MLVVVPCGGKKSDRRSKASEMYVGPYHRACMAYARSLVESDTRVVILSAKYGFLRLDDEIDPYEVRMGSPSSIGWRDALRSAKALGIADEGEVVALGGRDYTSVCRMVWPHCSTPLQGVGGIGKQLAWLLSQVKS